MPQNIAVYIGEDGKTTPLADKGKIIVFQKKEGKWLELKEKKFHLEHDLKIRDIRIKLEEIIVFLDDCKIFVGFSVVGIPYFMLEKANFSIWECKGKPLEFLDYVLEQEKETPKKSSNNSYADMYSPKEISPGNFSISLIDIQNNNIKLTSKQVLLPFLRKNKFYSLEIICNHIPPWLEGELLAGNFSKEIQTIDDKVKIVVTKNVL